MKCWQKAKGKRQASQHYCLLPIAFCLFVLRELVFVADGEFPAALGAAAAQDVAAPFGGHAGEEPVLAQARDALGLVGSFGHGLRAPVARFPERTSSRIGIERRWSQKRAAANPQRQ